MTISNGLSQGLVHIGNHGKKVFIKAMSCIHQAFCHLRHEATTRLFEKGLNIMEVASITGHRDLRMLRRHTHLKAEDLARKLG